MIIVTKKSILSAGHLVVEVFDFNFMLFLTGEYK